MTRALVRSSSHISPLRITTAAGVFDAVAAGPEFGPKVLLLHGFLQSGLQWDHQMERLAAAGYRAVAPDQRGYSPGVRPTAISDYWLGHAVDDVVAMADALGWHRFDLVGHDWGAAVGWIAAARYAHRVRSLTALSIPHLGAFAGAMRTDPTQRRMAKVADLYRLPSPIPENHLWSMNLFPGVPMTKTTAYRLLLAEEGALTAALNWCRANDFVGYTQRVKVPTCFITGTKDPFIAPSGIQATRSWCAGRYTLENLVGVGHNIPDEAPETTSLLLRRHLDSV